MANEQVNHDSRISIACGPFRDILKFTDYFAKTILFIKSAYFIGQLQLSMKVYDIRPHSSLPAGPRLRFVDTFAKLPSAFSRNANSADGPWKIRGKRRHVRESFITVALASSDFSKIRRVILVSPRER